MQIIDEKKYYFNLNTGIMCIGFKKIDGKVYEFKNSNPNIGSLEGVVSISINGANNTNINLGTKFNPMAGVTLNDREDPQAKILVSGTVDTNIPGIYKLTYTVKDSYGQTASVTRDIVIKGSKTEDIYWENNSLVINGDIVLNNKEISKNIPKEIPKGTKMQLVSKEPSGKVVLAVNGIDVNWYSNNEENYNGFQVIIAPDQVKNILGKNKLYVKVILNGHIKEFSI
ncbi:DUF5011 domain-containing protein [Clostridium massiliamazoniense]|uniref:DUF5011 domain-containing protein n=1 Tax=Clostridium massiliamazoniense TaxID=1347366 RepID=UPI0006D86326|nr:DUF5011 domain-containing protein [Clostridium massiliamazoniense]